MTLAVIVALAVLVVAGPLAGLAAYLQWERTETGGMAYFGRPRAQRRALKERIARRSRAIVPIVEFIARLRRRSATMPAFRHAGVCGPPGVCSAATFASAAAYRPTAQDVFVATQMRCGTTWMQQLVHQIVTRGRGDLPGGTPDHLYALSPWIEATLGIPLAKAPLAGYPPTRIVKTHLPAALCPYAPEARYIYVARHPVSCFASIVDFNRMMLGPLLPPLERLADWYCSDRMWWSSWPAHVAGWWAWAEERHNVLFVHYEEMKRDFASVRDRVARFLGHELTDAEKQSIDRHCSFAYMQQNEECFEMAPPSMFSVAAGRFLARGTEQRNDAIDPQLRERILAYCAQQLAATSYPAARFYPALALGEPSSGTAPMAHRAGATR